MKMIRKTKLIMVVFLVFVMLPVAGGVFCHCCEASEVSQTVIEKVPCQHCCGNLMPASRCEGLEVKNLAIHNPFESLNLSETIKVLKSNPQFFVKIDTLNFSPGLSRTREKASALPNSSDLSILHQVLLI
jgi:hypothetical protein